MNEQNAQYFLELFYNGKELEDMDVQSIINQHPEVERITGVEIRERVPDKVLARADEVVNIDSFLNV